MSILTNPPQFSLSRYAELLTKLSSYFLGVALLCYLTGFVITNMYLGSLGVVNLDILRPRYVLSGFLFLVMLGAIALMVYGLILNLRENRRLPLINLMRKVAAYSFTRIVFVSALLLVLPILPGIRIPISGNSVAPSVPTLQMWLETQPAEAFRYAALVDLVAFIISVTTLFIILAINPKPRSGLRESRKQVLKGYVVTTKNSWMGLIGIFAALFLVVFVVYVSASLMAAIGNLSGSSYQYEGWIQYVTAIIIAYVFSAVFLSFEFMISRSSNYEPDVDQMSKTTGLMLLLLIAVPTILIPSYTHGIYPNLPQQIGGGKILRVEIFSSSNELRQYFEDPNTETYLIDRTSASTLFQLRSKDKKTWKVVEVANPLIQSITYNLSP